MTDESSVAALREMINGSDNIVFFGGAGISTESGIPDFRSDDGIYNRLDKLREKYDMSPEYMLSHSFFADHTADFFEYYRNVLVHPEAKPNKAHYALAKLESIGKLKAVITQNVDGLHTAAGSKRVYELHGCADRNYCVRCGKSYPLSHIMESDGIPRCTCGGIVKPDVVLYEEPLNDEVWQEAVRAVRQCDMLIVGGTSLTVYPAAGLVVYYRGDKLVIINKSPTPFDGEANLSIASGIGEALSSAI